MENKESKQIYAILGGVIACFICLALVFLFPKGSSNLSNGNYNSLIPNNNEEEIALGDTSHCTSTDVVETYNVTATATFSGQCPSSYEGVSCTAGASGCSATVSCYCTVSGGGASGTNYVAHKCEYQRITKCTACEEGYYKYGYECKPCDNGKYCPGGTSGQQDCPDDGDTACWDGVKHSCSALDPNAIPYDVENPSYCMCKKGYSATGDSGEICPAGTYSEGDGYVCRSCPAGYYCAGGAADPAECPKCNGSVKCFSIPDNASSVNQCYGTVPAGKKITCNSTGCTFEDCEAGTVSASKSINYSTTLKTTCEPCPSNTVPNENHSACVTSAVKPEITCTNPKYTGSPLTIATCSNGSITGNSATATNIGTYTVSCQGSQLVSKQCEIKGNVDPTVNAVCCCTADKAMCSWMTACTSSKPLPQSGVESEMECKDKESGEIPATCTVSVSISSKAVSITSNGEDDANSYYTVTVKIKGRDCGGKVATYSATNAKAVVDKTYTVPSGSVSSTVSFRVYPETPCKASTATAKLSNGESSSATMSANNIRTDWKEIDDVCVKETKYTEFYLADLDGQNAYYQNYGTCKDGSQGYTVEWRRYLCGSSTPDTPNTPTTNDPKHCYLTNDGYEFHNESEATGHGDWKIADDKVFGDVCGPTPGCYMKISDGSYEVLQEQKEGYIYISASTDPNVCKKENWACYTKTTKDAEGKEYTSYVWSGAQPEGYQKATYSKEECQNPACYVHGDKVEWGKYSGVVGYIELEGVDEDECHIPGTGSDACYVGKDGNYVWGKYDDDSNYTLVPSVTDKAQCNNNVPVKPTGTSTSTIIYIFMAILMAFGIGFIYYSTVLNKNN